MKYFLTAFFLTSILTLSAQDISKFKTVSFKTSDGLKIVASYQKPKSEGVSFPAIILIHQGGSSRQEWLKLPVLKKLLNNGYVLLAYDIRQHGESDKDKGSFYDLFSNPNRAPLDLLAAIGFLKADKQIDSKRIGILGASIGANLACMASDNPKYKVKSVVSISAKTKAAKNLNGKNMAFKIKNAFLIASEDDQNGLRKNWAQELYQLTTGQKKLLIASGKKHGSFIIREQPAVGNTIVAWFLKTL